jgi:phosphohistidine phosphatase
MTAVGGQAKHEDRAGERLLLLIRHAKSAWPDGVRDHDRPLAPRGRADAPEIGRWLAERDYHPDLALVSTATRAQQTWQLALETLGSTPRTVSTEDVYGASAGRLVGLAAATDPGVRVLALVGHNPGMEIAASVLDDGSGDAYATSTLRVKFPTSAIAVLQVPRAGWSAVQPGSCRLLAVAAPRG